MAVFHFQEKTCVLDFEGKCKYELPLSENELQRIIDIASDIGEKLSAIKGNDITARNEMFNISLDGFDHILGEGAGEALMGLYENPGAEHIKQLVEYIATEYTAEYKKAFGEQKKTADLPRKGGRR